jgi:HSP20 family protein
MLPVMKTNHVFPGLMSEFLDNSLWNNIFENRPANVVPAVNIVENKNEFKIEVAAPGLEKSDFKINIDNDLLIISAEKENEKESKDEKFVRREFSYNCFKRAFSLPEEIDNEKITASHKEGILTVVVPKKENTKANTQRAISIS